MAIFNGTVNDDTVTGADTDDVLSGLDGNDRLIGGLGADQLNGGDGRDFAVYAGFGSRVVLVADLLTDQGQNADAEGDTYVSIEGLIGSDWADRLIGDNLDNWLIGGAGDDEITGNGGDDRITGGLGGDTLSGGAGEDWLIYRQSDAGVTVNIGTNLAQNGDAENDVISGFEHLVGSDFADVLTGSSADNILQGEAGADTLRGGDGDDLLFGGLGADLLDGGDGFDTVSYADATENASVNTRNSQMLGAAAGDTLISIEGLRGTEFGDSLILGDGANRIVGGGGDDFIDGGRGNDKLIGGAGADFLHGGSGIDTAIYRASDAAIEISMANSTTKGGHAEGDTLSWIHNIDGSQFGDVIEGDILDNRLRGVDGDDVLTGRAGSDKLVGGAGADAFAFVDLADHTLTTQTVATTLGTYANSNHDQIKDFLSGTDMLQFDGSVFAGTVTNTDRIADLNLLLATETGFAFTGSDLFYVRFDSAADFNSGLATVHHLANLNGVASLTNGDLDFV